MSAADLSSGLSCGVTRESESVMSYRIFYHKGLTSSPFERVRIGEKKRTLLSPCKSTVVELVEFPPSPLALLWSFESVLPYRYRGVKGKLARLPPATRLYTSRKSFIIIIVSSDWSGNQNGPDHIWLRSGSYRRAFKQEEGQKEGKERR